MCVDYNTWLFDLLIVQLHTTLPHSSASETLHSQYCEFGPWALPPQVVGTSVSGKRQSVSWTTGLRRSCVCA